MMEGRPEGESMARRSLEQQPPADRTAFLPAVDEAPHGVLFYEGDRFLIDSVVRFLSEGLQAGQAVIAIATRAHRQRLEHGLTEAGFDVAQLRRDAHLIMVDASEALASVLRDRRPDPERFGAIIDEVLDRVAADAAGVRVFGEMSALLVEDGEDEAALALEQLAEDRRAALGLPLLCAYPMRAFEGEHSGETFQRVCSVHEQVVPSESYSELHDANERARAVAILQQEAVAGINARVSLRHSQHALEEELRLLRALDRLHREVQATVVHDARRATGDPDHQRPRSVETLQKTATRVVRRTLSAAACHIARTQARHDRDARDVRRDEGGIAVPIRARGAVRRMLVVELGPDRDLDHDEEWFLHAVAELLGVAIEHDEAHAELTQRSLHDELTGLPNRTLLWDRLDHALRRHERTGGCLAVLALDVDDFSDVNERLGEQAADQVLAMIAERLSDALSPGDTIARLGGDTFVIVAEDLDQPSEALGIAQRLRTALAPALVLGEAAVELTASVGITVGDPLDGADSLLGSADLALQHAKRRPDGRWAMLDASDALRTPAI